MKTRFSTGIALLTAAFLSTLAAAHAQPATNLPPVPATVAGTTNAGPHVPGREYTNTLGMELVQVGGFWAARYETTQQQYRAIMGSNPSAFPGDQRPVDNVSWNEAMEFCRKLTESEISTNELPKGYTYSLPTEAQWDHLAASSSLDDSVTSAKSPRAGTSLVGSLGPNALGLYDVRGNVMEFCLGDPALAYRVLRGGSWQDRIEINLRLVFRNYCPPTEHKNTYGFRCVLLPPATPPK